MDSVAGFRKSGTFAVPTGTQVQGDLILKSPKTTLELFSQDGFSTHCKAAPRAWAAARGGDDERHRFASLFAHAVIFGNGRITGEDQAGHISCAKSDKRPRAVLGPFFFVNIPRTLTATDGGGAF